MFMISFKLSKKKIFIVSTLILCVITLIVCAAAMPREGSGELSLKAPDDTSRTEFLKQLGWEVVSVPIEIKEVKIPAEFNKIFEDYNKLQKVQGFDLSLYKLCRVKRYTYEIVNYPNQTDVRANLLVYNDTIIGGDVSTVTIDGFMHELTRKPEPEELKTSVYIDID